MPKATVKHLRQRLSVVFNLNTIEGNTKHLALCELREPYSVVAR